MSARIEPLKQDDLPELAHVFEMYDKHMGFTPNSVLTMAHKPYLIEGHAAIIRTAFLHPDSTVPIALKQCMAEIASQTRGCMYCQAHFASNAVERYGVPAEKLQDVWNFLESPHFNDAERAAMSFAMASAQAPNSVTEEHFAELRAHWDEKQIVEMTMVLAVVAYLNTWNDTMGTPLEESPAAIASEHLQGARWTPGKHGRP